MLVEAGGSAWRAMNGIFPDSEPSSHNCTRHVYEILELFVRQLGEMDEAGILIHLHKLNYKMAETTPDGPLPADEVETFLGAVLESCSRSTDVGFSVQVIGAAANILDKLWHGGRIWLGDAQLAAMRRIVEGKPEAGELVARVLLHTNNAIDGFRFVFANCGARAMRGIALFVVNVADELDASLAGGIMDMLLNGCLPGLGGCRDAGWLAALRRVMVCSGLQLPWQVLEQLAREATPAACAVLQAAAEMGVVFDGDMMACLLSCMCNTSLGFEGREAAARAYAAASLAGAVADPDAMPVLLEMAEAGSDVARALVFGDRQWPKRCDRG